MRALSRAVFASALACLLLAPALSATARASATPPAAAGAGTGGSRGWLRGSPSRQGSGGSLHTSPRKGRVGRAVSDVAGRAADGTALAAHR
eukprot:CAMPEP_0185200618 /NCGR_PEP_ID=MMETSP1140-20130426/47654_1 /TAXON_ID=298111 /ORGANISM="Pavlova sp., Strain CCMP459" /LENGTH=90 /DNA_ID=CAMNT_0027767967 /DNA_START=1 /DNA_END=270 /DNA_ORIENTATION=+